MTTAAVQPRVGQRRADPARPLTGLSARALSRGKLGRRFPCGAQVVWITTLGRKSGEWRKTSLLAVPDFGGWGIAGSNADQKKIPGWTFNVRAHDQGQIEIDGEVSDAVFREVSSDEAARLYQGLGEAWSSYRMYERNIGRDIPVFRVSSVNNSDA